MGRENAKLNKRREGGDDPQLDAKATAAGFFHRRFELQRGTRSWWKGVMQSAAPRRAIPDHFPNVELDEFIIVPDHVHAIITLME